MDVLDGDDGGGDVFERPLDTESWWMLGHPEPLSCSQMVMGLGSSALSPDYQAAKAVWSVSTGTRST